MGAWHYRRLCACSESWCLSAFSGGAGAASPCIAFLFCTEGIKAVFWRGGTEGGRSPVAVSTGFLLTPLQLKPITPHPQAKGSQPQPTEPQPLRTAAAIVAERGATVGQRGRIAGQRFTNGAQRSATDAQELAVAAHESAIAAHELTIGAHELAIHAHELATRGHVFARGPPLSAVAGVAARGGRASSAVRGQP